MTEDKWLASNDPAQMLCYFRVKDRRPSRKLRLYAVACCRYIWHLVPDAIAVEPLSKPQSGMPTRWPPMKKCKGLLKPQASSTDRRLRPKVRSGPRQSGASFSAPLHRRFTPPGR